MLFNNSSNSPGTTLHGAQPRFKGFIQIQHLACLQLCLWENVATGDASTSTTGNVAHGVLRLTILCHYQHLTYPFSDYLNSRIPIFATLERSTIEPYSNAPRTRSLTLTWMLKLATRLRSAHPKISKLSGRLWIRKRVFLVLDVNRSPRPSSSESSTRRGPSVRLLLCSVI